MVLGTGLTRLGMADLAPLPWWQTLAVFAYAAAACLLLNDAAKVVLLRRIQPSD